MEELLPFLERVEREVWNGSFDFSKEDEQFLCQIVSENGICNSISLLEKVDFEVVENCLRNLIKKEGEIFEDLEVVEYSY